MRLTILEPEASGHHMILYLRCIAQEAIRRRWQLHLVTTERATTHPAYQVVRAECGDSLQTSIMNAVDFPAASPSLLNLLKFQYQQFHAFEDAYRNVVVPQRPDAIYVVNFDNMDKVLAILGSPFGRTPFSGMLMSVRFHHRHVGVRDPGTRSDRLFEWLFYRVLRLPTLCALTTINQPLLDYVRRRKLRECEKIHYTPDIAVMRGQIERNAARNRLGIQDQQVVILVYGTLSPRKGIRELLKAVADPSCPETTTVLLAGEQDEDIQGFLSTPDNQHLRSSGRLIVMHGFLSDAQESLAFHASDIVWLGYRSFYGMSGVLVQAGMMRLPILACREGIIGWMTSQNDLGEIVDVDDHAQVLGAIERLVTSPDLRLHYGSHGASMAQSHTESSFANAICDAISEGFQDIVKTEPEQARMGV